MSPFLLLALLVIIGVVLFKQWLARTPAAEARRKLRHLGLAGIMILLVILAATGRLNPLFAVFAALLPALVRLVQVLQYVPLLRRFFGRSEPGNDPRSQGPGQRSRLNTLYLRMRLDAATGRLHGTVQAGTFNGRALDGMTLHEDPRSLLTELRAADPDSVAVLEAYLDQQHGAWRRDSRQDSDSAHRAGRNGMSREEAYSVLGLAPEASAEEVVAAHRRLMQKMHPDRGGSTYLASKINQAKERLLNDRPA